MLQKWGRLRLRHIRDIREVCQAHLGETQGGGVAVNEFEHPASGAILGQQGPFGKGECEQVMELVDPAGALADDGLEPAGDLAQGTEFEAQECDRSRLLGAGEACGGAGFDRIGLLATKESGTVILVALRIAAGAGQGQGRGQAGNAGVRSAEAVQEVE